MREHSHAALCCCALAHSTRSGHSTLHNGAFDSISSPVRGKPPLLRCRRPVMNSAGEPTPSFTTHSDSPDVLHDPLSHDLLASHPSLDIDLDCLAESETALASSPANHISLTDSRDLIFGDIEHVEDHVKDDHISMVEAVDPAVDSQLSPESSQDLKRVKVCFSLPFSQRPSLVVSTCLSVVSMKPSHSTRC